MITGYFILVSLLITRCFSSAIVSAPIKYGGQELVLDFPATVDDARIMALKFCREKLDLVDNTIEKQNCVKSLSKYLEAEVQKFLQKKMKESTSNDKSQRQSSSNVPTKEDKQVKVSLNSAGNQYELSYVPIEEPVEQVARRFCTQYQPNLGLTMNELHRCIEPVTSRLLEMESSSTKTSKNNDFIHSHDKQQTKQSMSSSSSSLSGAKKNTNTRKPPNNNHSKKSKDGKITITLNIQGSNYDISYDPASNQETPQQAATQFCQLHAEQWGITMDTFDSYCVQPIATQLLSVLQQ